MMEELIQKLYSIGAIKLVPSDQRGAPPFQIDLSVVISHPTIGKNMAAALWEKAQGLCFDLLCGGSPLGSCIAAHLSWNQEKPLVACHKEAKSGIHRTILGSYKTGQRCLLMQDHLASGNSTLHTIDHLEEEGLEVKDVVAFLDLQLGAKKKIKGRGYIPHCLITISEVVQILYDANKIGGDIYKFTLDYLEEKKESSKR